MAVILNAKGTSVPYFKIGKNGVTVYQGGNDPHTVLGYAVSQNDLWVDTNTNTIKYRTSSDTWEKSGANELNELEDVDLTGIADGYILKYNSTSGNWEPNAVSGGVASDWGSITDNALSDIDGYTGTPWSVNTGTATLSWYNDVTIGGDLTVSGNATISGNLTFGNADTDTVSFSADINSNLVPNTDATYDLGSSTQQWNDTYISGTIDNSSNTGAMIFPTGTTAQRPSTPQAGMVRFNSTTSRFEGYNGSEWINIDIPDDWGLVTETP